MSDLLDRVLELGDRLRTAGVEVSTGELLDAAAVLAVVDLSDRPALKACLRATMVKTAVGVERFDRLFDAVFRATGAPSGSDHATPAPGGDQSRPSTPNSMPTMSADILDALRRGDAAGLRALAAQAVELASGLGEQVGSEAYFLHRVLRAIDLSRMLSAALQQARRDGLDELELALHRSELGALLDKFRKELAAVIAARLADLHPDVDLAAGVTDPADTDVMRLSGAELAEVRRTVQPLARQLAARIGRRNRLRSTGRLDTRRTIHRSLQTGGIPIDVISKRRHPHRPELVLLCDVSGSVAEFAQFTFTLVNAIHAELSRVRSFAFVDGVGEVTDLFANALYDIPVARFVEQKGVLGPDGHSDYGRVFGQFVERHLLEAVGPRSTVIITGDARTNYRPTNARALQTIADRARRVYWLNPEPHERWDAEDSVVGEYRQWCDGIFEVRTLGQLADAIAAIV